jgi:uncharacterized membrane protein
MFTLTTFGRTFVARNIDAQSAALHPAPTFSNAAGQLKRYLVVPLILLVVALLVLRTAGAFGVTPLEQWPTAARLALALMFAFTAIAHFTRQKESLIRMVPAWMPAPRQVVAATGVMEVLGAFGLLLPLTATPAGVCLAVLLVAMFPANVNAARQQVMIGTKPATPLWFRSLVQLFFIAALVWATRATS